MKWYGWGHPHVTFPMEEKPDLWPFVKRKLGMERDLYQAPVQLKDIRLPESRLSDPGRAVLELEAIVGQGRVSLASEERLVHAFGKSYPDLYRARAGVVERAPDVVVWPSDHEAVVKVIAWAKSANVHVIPFGGGTNIAGCLDVKVEAKRPVLSLDMRAMGRLLELKPETNLALLEVGATGPVLEKQLGEQGFSLGHFPDSFEFSTLGGWIATRSAGMQSDAYGRIEDMVQSLHAVTSDHVLELKPFPATSAGPDVGRALIGSEGSFGVITRAWMRVHKTPEKKRYVGFLFKTFTEGLAAVKACHDADIKPSLVRLQDEGETELAFHLKSPKPLMKSLVELPVKRLLKGLGYTRPAIMVVGFEGTDAETAHRAGIAHKIFKRHGGFPLGDSIGDAWSRDKYNTPYLRDYVMDYGGIADVAETATTWENLVHLHGEVLKAVSSGADQEGVMSYVGCHLSHTYATGGCLYFTWATLGGSDPLGRYYRMKAQVTDAIVKAGGTLSHHHAVGTEHLPWLAQEIGPGGVALLGALKQGFDPSGMFNPGGLAPLRKHEYLGGPRG